MKYFGPRERLLSRGAKSLNDTELIAVLLGSARLKGPARDEPGALVAAKTLLDHFGSLHQLVTAPPQELQRFAGLGPQKSAMLLAIAEISERLWAHPSEERRRIRSPEDAYYLFSDLQLEHQEVVAAAFLTANHRLIGRRVLFRGTANCSTASPREIFALALRLNSQKVVVAHNHPSGDVEPSKEDQTFTRQLQSSGKLLGIYLLDHLIIGKGGNYYSFSQSSPWRKKPSRELGLPELSNPVLC